MPGLDPPLSGLRYAVALCRDRDRQARARPGHPCAYGPAGGRFERVGMAGSSPAMTARGC